MADYREQFTTEIYVNQEQANDAIGKLRDKVDQTAKAYEKLLNTKDADTAKTEKARKAWEAAKSSLENVEKGVDEYGKALKNLSDQSMSNLLKMQQKINAELKKTKPGTDEWKKLANEYAQVTNRIKDLRKAQDDIVTRSGGLKGALERVTAAGNKFGTAIMALPTAIKGFTAALSGVIKVTKQVINASQTMGDKWNNGMAAMKTTTEAFFFSLSTGDWSAFNDGITGALKKARELAELMDLMGSYDISNMYMQTEYETTFREALADYNDPSKTDKEREEALVKAENALTEYQKFLKGWGIDTRKALIEAFDVKGIDYTAALDEENEDAQAAFDHFFDELYKNVNIGKNKVVNELNDLNEEARKKGFWATLAAAFPSSSSQEAIDNFTEATQKLTEATQSATEEERNLRLASQLNDETLTGLIQTYQKQREATRKAARMQNTYNNALKGGTTNTNGNTKATDAYAEAIKKVDRAEKAQLITLKQLYASGIIDKTRYEAEKAVIEEDFLKQKMATAEKYGKDTDQFMSQLLDRQIARMDKAKAMLKEEMEEMERYNDGLRTEDERRLGASTGSAANGGIADQEAYDSFQEKIWQKAADIRAAITEDSARTEYETEVAWAQKLAEQKKITAEEAEKYILQAKLKYAQAAAQQVSQITEQASNFVAALKEAESAKLEAEYQRQIAAAGDNAEQREQIDAAYEQKKLDLQKKYADTEMAINIAKTIAAGALAAIQAFAQLGPIGGAIAAALIAVTTAAEVATIIQQRNAIKSASVSSGGGSSSAPTTGERKVTGYADGGYTVRSASDRKAAGVVHANEWVAPAWMVRQNPITFANLERYRKAGSHGRSGSVSRGFADGGFTETGGKVTAPVPAFTKADLEEAVETAISRSMANGAIRAYLVRKDLTELDAQDARFKAQTSRG